MEKDILNKLDQQRAPKTLASLLWYDGLFLWFCRFVDMFCYVFTVFVWPSHAEQNLPV